MTQNRPFNIFLGLLPFILFSCQSTTPTEPETVSAEPETPFVNAVDILAEYYSGTKDIQDALKALEALGVENMDGQSRLVYAQLLRTDGRYDEARNLLKKLLAEDAGLSRAWFDLAVLEHAAGRAEERDAALKTVLRTDPEMAEAWAFLGTLARDRKDWDEAERAFRTALEKNADLTEALMGLAWVLAKTDREEEALPFLDRAVENEPEHVYARVDRSRLLTTLGRNTQAEKDLNIVIELEPDVLWHYLDRARIRLRHFKDMKGALEDLEMVERLNPGNFFALVYLAGLHDEERHYDKALHYYLQIMELREDYHWAYAPLGKLQWIAGDYAAAEHWFLKAAADNPEPFAYPVMAALAKRAQGNEAGSRKLLADTLRKFKPGETIYEVIRFCLERGSDFHVANSLNKESNATLRDRLRFYMGVTYGLDGLQKSEQAVYSEIAHRVGEIEFDMAHAALEGN